MNDIEVPVFNQVYNAVYDEFHGSYPDLTILNDRPESLAKFPAVICVEDDNITYSRDRDLTSQEQYSEVMYTVEIYTDNRNGHKTLAKQIAGIVDAVMIGLRFQRMSFAQMPNVDRDVTRYVGRYRAVVSHPFDRGTDNNNLPQIEYYLYRR